MSGKKHADDTVITVFQEEPQNSVSKSKQSTTDRQSIQKFQRLKRQEVVFYNSGPEFPLPDSLKVATTLFNSEKKKKKKQCGAHTEKSYKLRTNISNNGRNSLITSWAGTEY